MGESESNTATANIYGGTFSVTGQAGFSVYQNVTVNFKKGYKDENGTGGDITVSANTVGIAIENTTNSYTTVNINGGTYQSTGSGGDYDGIWYSNPNAKLNISGGVFTGSAVRGCI